MTRLLLSILILLAFGGCKKENNAVPLYEIASIVGKWRAVESRQTLGDSTTTQSIPKANAWVYEFRFDGVLLNGNGYLPCCLPSMYYLNGSAFKPKPAIPTTLDPMCANSLCVFCPEMHVTQTAPDTLVIETCKGSLTIFAREE